MTDPAGGKASLAYDALGRTIKTTNPNGHATSYEYDARGRLVEEVDPLRNVTAFSYDGAGNLTGRTDAERRTTEYAYDAANRPVSTSYPDGTKTLATYDENGNLTSAANENGKLSFAYDARNLLTRETLPDGRSTSHEYDAAGSRTALVDPAGGRTAYAYDAAGRLAAVTGRDGAKTTYSYDSLDRSTRVSFPGGAAESYAYDPLGRVSSVTGSAANGEVLARLSYGYDKANNPISVADGDKTSAFAYDDLDRLLKETHPEKTLSYGYDAAGNRASMTEGEGVGAETTTYDYDAAERLTRAGEAAYAYDGIGNQTSMTVGRNTTRYAYDPEGRITKAGNVGFGRDALGRVASTERLVPPGPAATELAPAQPTSYAYDGDRVIQEEDEKGTTAHYTRGLGGDLLSRKAGSDAASYYRHDAAGSVVGLTDGASKLTDSYRYSAFGEELSRTGSTANPFGYVGNRAEPAAGLSDFRARAYDPSTGRFTSEDPVRGSVAEAQTMNPYAYARNAPLAYTDPDGRFAFAGSVVAVAVVVAAPVVIGGAVGCAISEVDCTGAIGDIISPDPALESEAVPTPEPPAPEPELQPAPGDEVLPSPESGMGADQKIPPASSAAASTTNGEDDPDPYSFLEDVFPSPGRLLEAGRQAKDLDHPDIKKLIKIAESNGWARGTLGRGSKEGQGMTLREKAANGGYTGRYIQYHPGGGRHGSHPYWKVSSPKYGTQRLGEDFPLP